MKRPWLTISGGVSVDIYQGRERRPRQLRDCVVCASERASTCEGTLRHPAPLLSWNSGPWRTMKRRARSSSLRSTQLAGWSARPPSGATTASSQRRASPLGCFTYSFMRRLMDADQGQNKVQHDLVSTCPPVTCPYNAGELYIKTVCRTSTPSNTAPTQRPEITCDRTLHRRVLVEQGALILGPCATRMYAAAVHRQQYVQGSLMCRGCQLSRRLGDSSYRSRRVFHEGCPPRLLPVHPVRDPQAAGDQEPDRHHHECHKAGRQRRRPIGGDQLCIATFIAEVRCGPEPQRRQHLVEDMAHRGLDLGPDLDRLQGFYVTPGSIPSRP